MKSLAMKATFSRCLWLLAGCFLLAACNQSQPPATKAEPAKEAKAADDPRMAGFNGKIGRTFAESVEDWPKEPIYTGKEPNVLLIDASRKSGSPSAA